MSDNGRADKLAVTWRSYAAVMLAVIGFFAVETYRRVDRTADAVAAIERAIAAVNGRLDAQAGRLEDHDRRIGRLETPFFAPRPN